LAAHIDNLKTCGIPVVTRDQFYKILQPGDDIYCSGQAAISKLIEKETGSILSHVLKAWLRSPTGPWLTIEATFERGVHVGLLSDYTGGSDGPIILTRRDMTEAQRDRMLDTMLGLIDDKYDYRQEVSMAAHKLLHFLPIVKPKGELYCSGLEYVGALNPLPYQYEIDAEHPNMPAPEDLFADPSTTAICMYTGA
jgi:hypothetical protein